MVMDIASLSMQASALQASDMVSVAVFKKTMDTIEVSGESMIQMMEQSVNPNLGQNIDLRV
ncbi:MAG: YjfB family protein [Lachnospiraceae bacterium]|nr:YjfB family protein [Lachnospiraceae bacterium]